MENNNIASVSFGNPITAPVLVPVEHKSTPSCINDPFMVDGKCYKVTAMSLGSPHGSVLVDNVDAVDVDELGCKLGTHVLFPKGASIVFIQMLDKESIKARLWQRDEGEADFTPEGACIAGVTAMILQRILGHEANITMTGGTYRVKWDRAAGSVSLTEK